MKHEGELAYVFWHWRRPSLAVGRYEARQRAFHAALAARPPAGFIRSSSSAFAGAPWANDGRETYQDHYFISSSAALDEMDNAVASGARRRAHDDIAAVAEGGVGGLYRVRLGIVSGAPRAAAWFSKPPGMSYDDLFATVAPLAESDRSWLWMRRLVLGPAREFCLESLDARDLPTWLGAVSFELRPVWPD